MIQTQEHNGSAFIAVNGELNMEKYSEISKALAEAMQSQTIKEVLLVFDSPGGEVFGVDILAERIFQARNAKPIYALINGLCCSCAYWLASACNQVLCSPVSMVGSIGVILEHVTIKPSEAAEHRIFCSAPRKTIGMQGLELDKEGEEELQSRVDALHGVFVEAVTRYRNKTDLPFDGSVFVGEAAKKAGLVDEVGYF